MGDQPPPPAQLQRSAARTTPGRIPRTVKLRARPCQRRPRFPPAMLEGEHTKIYSPCCPLRTHPSEKGRCAQMEGRGSGGREEKSTPLRRGWGWAAAVRTAGLRPPHCGACRPCPAKSEY